MNTVAWLLYTYANCSSNRLRIHFANTNKMQWDLSKQTSELTLSVAGFSLSPFYFIIIHHCLLVECKMFEMKFRLDANKHTLTHTNFPGCTQKQMTAVILAVIVAFVAAFVLFCFCLSFHPIRFQSHLKKATFITCIRKNCQVHLDIYRRRHCCRCHFCLKKWKERGEKKTSTIYAWI